MLADVTVSEVGVTGFVTTEQKHRYEKRNDGGGGQKLFYISVVNYGRLLLCLSSSFHHCGTKLEDEEWSLFGRKQMAVKIHLLKEGRDRDEKIECKKSSIILDKFKKLPNCFF